MPEGVEIELYRRATEPIVGRTIAAVRAGDDWFLKGGLTAREVTEAVVGQRVEANRRKGKLLVLDLSNGIRLGLRFGMTGRPIVDSVMAIDDLEYASNTYKPEWDRFVLEFTDGGDLKLQDPRRLGGVQLDPDEDALGVDAFEATLGDLRRRVLVGEVALKARLLDQSRLAGVGNLIADEVLWRASLDPARAAGSLAEGEERRLHRHLRNVLRDFLANGGSHTGRLQPARVRGGHCPKDGVELLRREIGGRTTYSCPSHQV
ncbi:MAG: formamidopyrimidine-DNA glycosylase [Actinomycetia bacterium]|nr:formamidopyrimidine-DNA glycosylase [Actinomycetes bacterium]MCP5035109.1 formamidopyrimidine-DNA glycosylase [Actinomycetes bacterium]